MQGGGNGNGGKGTSRVSWSIWPMEDDDWTSPARPIPTQHLPISSADNHNMHAQAEANNHHHLTCLKLGKRQYCEEPLAGGPRKERTTVHVTGSSSSSSSCPAASTPVPRCQVEGCNVGLADAKEYHRRHKVCEAHSKSPKVVVLGLEQRFCQQCSRFHVLSEFDDAKRSCRRRLAGHNERRSKSSNDSTIPRNPTLDYVLGTGARFPYLPSSNSPGCALSLLSSETPSRWVSPELSYRSSAALRELIAENRATLFSRQLLSDRDPNVASQAFLSYMPHQHQLPILMPGQLTDGWETFRDNSSAHVTLDLMQVPSPPYGMLSSGRSKSKEDEDCCEIWKSLEESHVA